MDALMAGTDILVVGRANLVSRDVGHVGGSFWAGSARKRRGWAGLQLTFERQNNGFSSSFIIKNCSGMNLFYSDGKTTRTIVQATIINRFGPVIELLRDVELVDFSEMIRQLVLQ